MKIWPGKPYPLGATSDGAGVNFSLFSENANKVELCLFDGPEGQRETRIPMREQTHQIWHIYLPEARPGKKRRTMRGGDIYDMKDRSIAMLQLPRSTNGEEKRTRSRSALRQIKSTVENRPLP